MKLIVYKNRTDDSVARIDSCDNWFERGKTLEDIEYAVEKFNAANNNTYIVLHDVAGEDEWLIAPAISCNPLLFAADIIHPCDEEIPADNYIYVFYKYEGHDFPTIDIMKLLHSEGVRLPEIRDSKNRLPIAWCKARELNGLLGMTKKDINQLTRTAKSIAWGWYNKED